MTAPYPAPGEFPDFEQLLIDLLTPIAITAASLPATGPLVDAALPMIWVRKLSGSHDINKVTYIAKVRVVAIAQTRTAAAKLAAKVREAVLGSPGTRVNGVLVDWSEELDVEGVAYHPPTLQRSQGTADFPNLDPLDRMVELGFVLHARRQ
ncbi:hypothetical protein [Nocardia sp. NPDC052566]|uniref:phage tail termination protein n=1 Tax=Nocardia sp. NPDC052566 TaxID=3364330 RepID=UPI0037CAE215